MNFVGHVVAAASASDDPDVWLGAALPDLLPRGVARGGPAVPDGVAAGIAHHHRADAAFHDDGRFRAWSASVRDLLEAAGVARGPRRAAGHAGVELLLDDALLGADGAPAFGAVWERLRAPDDVVLAAVAPAHRPTWAAGLARLTGRLDPWAHRGPAAAAERLTHLLARRPRLALAEADAARVAAALAEIAPEVAAGTPALVADVARRADEPR